MHLGIVSDWKKPYYKRKMQRMISNRGILIYSSGQGKGIEQNVFTKSSSRQLHILVLGNQPSFRTFFFSDH